MLGCLELVKNRKTKEPMAPYNAKASEMAIMNKVGAKLKELGMYTFVRWNYVFIAPPLIITKEQVDEIAGFFREKNTTSLAEAKAHFGERFMYGQLRMVLEHLRGVYGQR